ncbi:serine O-acetyltransferase [Clostridium paraputrificum]|uniref:Serine acetyltransferase n=1 Tax=Clostridium paraputrificum TaxID=29363 RepID=A0A1B8RS78_9CLOT|nr:hypothetical protein [Clostridium paraputrificum]OBY11662.1 hypothetical protein CP373A1_04525 [Clostridium paraputrificum]
MSKNINTRKQLSIYLNADMIMNRGVKLSFSEYIKSLIKRDYIMMYLRALRKTEYYKDKSNFLYIWNHIWFSKHGRTLGISIEPGVFKQGLVIPHNGTIVIGGGNTIGAYCVLHTGVCITNGNKMIGEGLYCSTGSKIINDVKIGDNVSIGANAVVLESVEDDTLVVGIPAKPVKKAVPWYIRDGKEFERRYKLCEDLEN